MCITQVCNLMFYLKLGTSCDSILTTDKCPAFIQLATFTVYNIATLTGV